MLIAFEGLDQSGKETQARHLRARLEQDGRKVRSLSFPDYGRRSARKSSRHSQASGISAPT
jgi:thymidylate kinase